MNPDGGNLHFVDLAETTWEEAREALDAERELLAEAAERAEPGGTLVELDGDDLDEIAVAELGPMDLGTSAATLALNAAGCRTVSSCAGHSDGHPYISFWTRSAWVPALVKAAETARVGLGNGNLGTAEVFTQPDDVIGLVRLAEELVKSAADFAALERTNGPEGTAALQRADGEEEGGGGG